MLVSALDGLGYNYRGVAFRFRSEKKGDIMNIRNKSQHDPVTDMGLPNNYMRWALEAIEEVAGKPGLTIILREAGLATLQENLPPDDDEFGGLTMGHYANLNAAILNFFGRAAKSMTMRIGRVSSRHAIEKQAELFNIVALTALKVMPLNVQVKLGGGQMMDGFRKINAAHGQQFGGRFEETDDAWLFIMETCTMCAGKVTEDPMCWLFTGSLSESLKWLTGKEFDIMETECRAAGAPACVWRVSKKPKE
jgi:predicted hydrocarbon binding protein